MLDSLTFALKKLGETQEYWTSGQRILLAVSGGIDSMVLLYLMLKIQKEQNLFLGVVHVNHQLREESVEEEAFLEAFCLERELPFYTAKWNEPAKVGIEAAAREFRYQFFAEVMQDYQFDVLMTAHHQDDQAETVLMRLVRGGNLHSCIGIVDKRSFAQGTLVRPLLSFSKKVLQEFAETEQVTYFEDSTNQQPLFQRNRIRTQILPKLKQENPYAAKHLSQFSQKLGWALELADEKAAEAYLKNVFYDEQKQRYEIQLTAVSTMSEAEQYYFFDYFFRKMKAGHGVGIKEQQHSQLLTQLKSDRAQWQMNFENNWLLRKVYQQLIFQPEVTTDQLPIKVRQIPSTGLFLNDREWLAVFPNHLLPDLPEETTHWTEFRREFFWTESANFFIRKRQPGDRLRLTESLTKRISRYFIDKKIPNSDRDKSWVITSKDKRENITILALLPFVFSYLSIAEETDTIQYTILYRYKTD